MTAFNQAEFLATKAGRTQRVQIVAGDYDLDLFVDPATDYDGEFWATCAETGDALMLKGWLIESITPA